MQKPALAPTFRAGVLWTSPEYGISGALKGRTLLIHAAEDFRDQGLALSFSWDSTPSSNRGPALSVDHGLGASVDGDLDVFLGPGWEEVTETIFPSGDQQQFEARFAYGFPVQNNHVTVSPALAWRSSLRGGESPAWASASPHSPA